MHAADGHAQARGFTLVELMLTLAVAAILAALGAPALGGLLGRVTTRTTEASIAGTLRHARTASVMENSRVIVCPSVDGRRCARTVEWQQGWLVARDADRDGQPDAGEPILDVAPAAPDGTHIITSAGRTHLVFHPNGSAAGSNVRFTVCHTGQNGARSVVLSNSGRVRVEASSAANTSKCLQASA